MSNAEGYPDFLVIGAPKAGTTWYFDNLKMHPKVWISPYKSAQYFSGWARQVRRKKLLQMAPKRILESVRKEGALWNLRHFFVPVNDSWYKGVFKPGAGLVTGDISPSYCGMTIDQIFHAKRLMPDAKVIFSIRNPIERSWSNAMLFFVRNNQRNLSTITTKEYRNFFDNEGIWNDYPKIIKKWKVHFSEDQFHVEFFEDIRLNPEIILKNLCNFLNLEYDYGYFQNTMRRNIFKGPVSFVDCPSEIKIYLAEKYLDSLKYMSRLFGGYATEWYEQADKIFNNKH